MRIRRSARPHAGHRDGLSRRAVLGGAGATLLAAGGFVNGADADAAPGLRGDGSAPAVAHPRGAPFTTTIASAPKSGYSYQTLCMYDFKPFNPQALLTWGGQGVYSAGTATTIRATFDLPPGALIRDIEYYVANTSTSNVTGDSWQYAAGMGTINSLSAPVAIPPATSVTATLVAVPPASAGPFPLGSRLLVGVSTPTDGSVQVNGVRIGYTDGQATIGLLPAPIRAYNSHKSGGILKAGTTRTITLPAGVVPPGTTGVLANITATGPTKVGYLKVYPGNQAAPVASALNFHSENIANALIVGVSSARTIKIFASQDVHVLVDITGILA